MRLLLLLRLLEILPRRVQVSMYYRFLRRHKHWYASRFKGVPLRHEPSMIMALSPSDVFHGELALFGLYEEAVTDMIHGIAKAEGGLLVDVGANYGYYSLLWCGAAPANRSFAVEASPANLDPLRRNIADNHLRSRVSVFAWAASNTGGSATFSLGSHEETGWGGIVATNPQAADADSPSNKRDLWVTVPQHRLDTVFAGQEISMLKIDCEGADAWVLEGAIGLLTAGLIKHIVFEENVPRQHSLGIPKGHAVSILEAHGYVCQQLDADEWIKTYRAERPAGQI